MTPLVCAGDGPLRPVLEALARDVPGIELAGWLDQDALAARMRTAQGLVVPSIVAAGGDAEGLPSVIPEAMARGCLVIASAWPGIAEVVTDGVTGLLSATGDADSLAAALRRASEPGLAPRVTAAAFAMAGERVNAIRQSARLEAILLEAAAQASP